MKSSCVEKRYLVDSQMNVPQPCELLTRDEVKALVNAEPAEYRNYLGIGIDVDEKIVVHIYAIPQYGMGTRVITYKAKDQSEYETMYREWFENL